MAFVTTLLGNWSVAAAGPDEAPVGRIAGDVKTWDGGTPVSAARIELPGYHLSTISGPDGSFHFPEPLPTDHPYRSVTVIVTARGWGTWTLSGAPLYPNDTLLINAELRAKSWSHDVRPPGSRSTAQTPASQSILASGNTCTGWDVELLPPPAIWVYLSQDHVSKQYDFYFYATHVLPREWYPSWDADALAAGAVAVKTYAAYREMTGHAFSSGPGCADVTDTTADQVFDPTFSTAATDQAVAVALGSILRRNGDLFLAQYWSGSSSDPCAPVTSGTYAGRMSQWGTQNCALQGMLWPAIDTTFYQGTKWRYLRDMILN
ncbi:MAG TPA: SpoIID/LytB domain-containing protein, partial [Actinomycetota bacterium]